MPGLFGRSLEPVLKFREGHVLKKEKSPLLKKNRLKGGERTTQDHRALIQGGSLASQGPPPPPPDTRQEETCLSFGGRRVSDGDVTFSPTGSCFCPTLANCRQGSRESRGGEEKEEEEEKEMTLHLLTCPVRQSMSSGRQSPMELVLRSPK